MASITVTYSFSNSTTADATQVNQNFTDIINGTSDGTKDFSINALTCAGNVNINGNTTIGNASSDTLTITASLASSIPIGTTNTYDIGSSTLGLRALYFGANSQTVNIKASSSMSATWTMTLPVTAGTSGYYLKTDGTGVTSWQAFTTPTVQKFTSGSGTYTTPANVKYIRVKMVGAGGGGGGGGTSVSVAAGNGGDTTFGASTAGGGLAGGAIGGAGGAGGTATLGSGHIGTALPGGGGGGGSANSAAVNTSGGTGGNSVFGGGGTTSPNAAGSAGATNTGGGGGGGGATNTISAGGGGGAGGHVDCFIGAPSSTYSYAVGAGGTAGQGNVTLAGAGAAGYIEVIEFYS